ncbi:MAG TPA: hypothetical protein VLC06_11885 [Polyangia bacterium]|nr:hypothetical protein [Polyangia bacterium]
MVVVLLALAATPVAEAPSDDLGAVRGDDLAKILAWAAAFDRATE